MPSSPETLAERLQRALKARSLSAREAAARLGVSQAAVSRWLNDERQPDTAGLQALMGLGISANWLLTGEGSPEPDRAASAQYRAGKRDGLAEVREAVLRIEAAQGAAEAPTPSADVARTVAQAQAASAAGTPTESAPRRRRLKGG